MNRYTAAGVLADMRQGRRVLVVSETRPLARLAFTEVAANAHEGEQIRRANGEERITANDGRGWIVFRSSGRNQMRGLTVDVLVFDAHDPGPAVLESTIPNVAGSAHGEAIRP